MTIKPMLASDYDESKLRFPLIVQPKIDGVRGLFLSPDLGFTGRSLKPHANKYTTEHFSHMAYYGLDGELIAERMNHPDLCRITTSAVATVEGQPYTMLIVFDWVTEKTIHLPYIERLRLLEKRQINSLQRCALIEWHMVNDLTELSEWESLYIERGYEGAIIRDPNGKYKQGRSTVREGGLLRIKRFADAEAVVVYIEEGQSNQNAATIGLLGQTERTTHKENMVPNGMVGALNCTDLITKESITVSAGCMTHDDRVKYFNQQELLIGKVIKYKHFAHGVKDKPRFPTFQGLRAESDM